MQAAQDLIRISDEQRRFIMNLMDAQSDRFDACPLMSSQALPQAMLHSIGNVKEFGCDHFLDACDYCCLIMPCTNESNNGFSHAGVQGCGAGSTGRGFQE